MPGKNGSPHLARQVSGTEGCRGRDVEPIFIFAWRRLCIAKKSSNKSANGSFCHSRIDTIDENVTKMKDVGNTLAIHVVFLIVPGFPG